MIYLDSSALVKLVRAEDCSEALQSWIDQRPERISGDVSAGSGGGAAGSTAKQSHRLWRTLDAIHLASVAELDLSDLVFVTYDHRLAAEAERMGNHGYCAGRHPGLLIRPAHNRTQ